MNLKKVTSSLLFCISDCSFSILINIQNVWKFMFISISFGFKTSLTSTGLYTRYFFTNHFRKFNVSSNKWKLNSVNSQKFICNRLCIGKVCAPKNSCLATLVSKTVSSVSKKIAIFNYILSRIFLSLINFNCELNKTCILIIVCPAVENLLLTKKLYTIILEDSVFTEAMHSFYGNIKINKS